MDYLSPGQDYHNMVIARVHSEALNKALQNNSNLSRTLKTSLFLNHCWRDGEDFIVKVLDKEGFNGIDEATKSLTEEEFRTLFPFGLDQELLKVIYI